MPFACAAFDFGRGRCHALGQRRRCAMRRARWIVAAALGGGALTTLIVATLALGAGATNNALVTLQVAPRGPGSVSAVPPPSAGDPHPCTGQDAENDCEWSYEQGTNVRLTAVVDAGAGTSFSGWSEPECGTSTSCTVGADEALTSVVAVFAPLMLAVKFSDDDGGATVSANPAGAPCDPVEEPGDAVVLPRLSAAHTCRTHRHPGDDPVPGLERAGRVPLRAHEHAHVHHRRRGSAHLGRGAVRERAAATARRPRSASSSSCARAATAAAA